MALENQRGTFHGSGVGRVAALGQSMLEELLRIGELRDLQARRALAAEIVGETLAVGGLGEHARQSELTNATCAGEKQSVWNARSAKCASQGGDNPLVTEEFGEAHESAFGHGGENGFHG
jgi:hypothetical protein